MKKISVIAKSFAFVLLLLIVTSIFWPQTTGMGQPNRKSDVPIPDTRKAPVGAVVVKVKENMKSQNEKKLIQHKQQDDEREALLNKIQADYARLQKESKEDKIELTNNLLKERKKNTYLMSEIKKYLDSENKDLEYTVVSIDTPNHYMGTVKISAKRPKDTIRVPGPVVYKGIDSVEGYNPFWSIFGLFGDKKYKPIKK